MEYALREVDVLEQAAEQAIQASIETLDELQLVLVGGGSGEVCPY